MMKCRKGLRASENKVLAGVGTVLVPVLFVLIAAALTPLSGQLKVHVDLVSVNVSVSGSDGRGVYGLSADDFVLVEDGIPQEIVGFDSSSEPFDLVLVIDSSKSTGGRAKWGFRTLDGLFQSLPSNYSICIVEAGDRVYSHGGFTENRRDLRRTVRNLRVSGTPGTRLYDAIDESLDLLGKGGERNALLIVSDGIDIGSRLGFEAVHDRIRAAAVTTHVIAIDNQTEYVDQLRKSRRGFSDRDLVSIQIKTLIANSAELYRDAHGRLEELAADSGGRFYSATSRKDLATRSTSLAHELSATYTLRYYSHRMSVPATGDFKGIEVQMRSPSLEAHARPGYSLEATFHHK